MAVSLNLRADDTAEEAALREALRKTGSEPASQPMTPPATTAAPAPAPAPVPVQPRMAEPVAAPAMGTAPSEEQVSTPAIAVEDYGALFQALRTQQGGTSMPASTTMVSIPPPSNSPRLTPTQSPEFTPLQAPALPISATKEQRLQALLVQYKADQITPQQYHTQRAAILAEP